MGNIVPTLLESGAKLVQQNVTNEGKVPDFEIVTVDIVAQPVDASRACTNPMNMRGGMKMHNMARYAHIDKVAQKHLAKILLS